MIENFKIAIPQSSLDDLKHRLANTRWPDRLRHSGWDFGADLDYMQELVAYWRDRYDWRAQEAQLNRLPQYRIKLGGLGVHFVHVRGKGDNPLPLIITHGWPGSFLEMVKILPLLTDPSAHGGDPRDAFHLVIPSLPGFGFSDRPTELGMNVFAIAGLWVRLMNALGYDQFAAQGGDWGSWVSTALGVLYPSNLTGVHLNFISTGFRPYLGPGTPELSEEERGYLDTVAAWRDSEGAYFMIQATKPQTLAYGLTDSPVGLASWIIEKFRGWSDCGGNLDSCFTKDDLLTNVMLYWLTNTAHSSIRLYSEARQKPFHLAQGQRVVPPCGIVCTPKEIPMPPRSWAERAFNVVHWSSLSKGGHFAAMEQPELLAEDVRKFFRTLRKP